MTALEDIGIPEVAGDTTWSFDFRGILENVQGYAFDSCEVLRPRNRPHRFVFRFALS